MSVCVLRTPESVPQKVHVAKVRLPKGRCISNAWTTQARRGPRVAFDECQFNVRTSV